MSLNPLPRFSGNKIKKNKMEDQKIQDNCRLLLTKYPELRNPIFKKQRIWKYWREFEDVNVGIIERQFIDLTDGESISRAFRKLQQETPDLRADIKSQQASADLAEEHRQNYSNENRKRYL